MNRGEISAEGRTSAAARALFLGLLLWSLGVQLNEIVASLGLVITGLTVSVIWLKEPERRLRLVGGLRVWWPLALFFAWATIAPALSGRPPTATGLARAIDWLLIPFAAYAVGALSQRHRKWIALAGVAIFLLSCAAAALQHSGLWPSPSAFERFSWTRIPFYRVYEPVPGAEGQFMGGGLLFHRLKFAHVGGLTVLAFLVLGLADWDHLRSLWLVTSAIGFLSVLAFPYARMASVALVLSASLALALSGLVNPRARMAAFALAALTLGAVAAYRPLRERFLYGLSSTGSGDRKEILSTGVRAVAEHPIAGVGLGQFRPSYFGSASTPQHVIDNPGKAHNEFLSIAAETGIPGLALFLFLLGWLARLFNPRQPLGVFGLSALAFFCLVSLAHDPLIHAPFSMALSLSLGAASARAPMSRR